MAQVRSMVARGLPRWLEAALGVVCVLVGAALAVRPFQSLAALVLLLAVGALVMGLSELGHRSESRAAGYAGIGWLLLGVVILVLPGLTIRTLAVLVGIALIGAGVARVVGALRHATDERLAALLLGSASVVLGLVALAWPDVTLLLVGLVFGVRLVLLAWRSCSARSAARVRTPSRRSQPAGFAALPTPLVRRWRWSRRWV